MWPDRATIAVVGATGAVGAELLAILAARGVDRARLRLAASRTAVVDYAGAAHDVRPVDDVDLRGVDVVLLAANAEVAQAVAPRAVDAGARVIDNSSAFRGAPGVPLLVPGVNDDAWSDASRLVANPNCTTILLVTALDPLRRAFGLAHVDVCTYQAASGAGASAIDALRVETRDALGGADPTATAFAEPCAFNVFSHDSTVDIETGVNAEERKVIDEARKIWADPALRITPTCMRVPVLRAHLLAVTVTMADRVSAASVEEALRSSLHLRWRDDRAANAFPTSLDATGRDRVVVGRLRPDPASVAADGTSDRWCLLVAGDQLRKGAALNAVQIVDHVLGT